VAVVFNIFLPVLVSLCFLAMLFFIWRAFRSRHKSAHQPYNVGRQEAHQTTKVNITRAVFLLILGLIFFAVIGVSPHLEGLMPALIATPSPEPESISPSPVATLVPTATKDISTLEPSPTSPVPTVTDTPLPTVTNTPPPLTATVSSGVGVWLRDLPGTETEQLEWLLEGTILIVFPGQETADDLLWRQVQTEEGLIGWVASDFIAINEP
jgi:hypothetical protein